MFVELFGVLANFCIIAAGLKQWREVKKHDKNGERLKGQASEEQKSKMDAKNAVSKFSLSVAETLCKYEFLILSFSALLYVDCIINIFLRKNIATFPWDFFCFSTNSCNVILLIIAYSALVSCIFPAFNFIIVSTLEHFRKCNSKNNLYNFHTMITCSSAMEFAISSNNTVLYERCKQIEASSRERRKISNYTFYIIFFAIVNFVFLGDAKNPTILQKIGNIHEYFHSIINNSVMESHFAPFISALLSRILVVMCLTLGCFFFFAWKSNSFVDEPEEVITNRALAQIINVDYIEREKKARKESFS